MNDRFTVPLAKAVGTHVALPVAEFFIPDEVAKARSLWDAALVLYDTGAQAVDLVERLAKLYVCLVDTIAVPPRYEAVPTLLLGS